MRKDTAGTADAAIGEAARSWSQSCPALTGELDRDLHASSEFWRQGAELRARLPPRPRCNADEEAAAKSIFAAERKLRERFLSLHVEGVYRRLTGDLRSFVRADDLVYAAATAFPGLTPTQQIVAQDGLIVQASKCNDGFPAHGNFKKLLFDHDSPRALLDTIMSPGFSMYDQWEAQLLAGVLLKARVGLYSELRSENVRRAHLEPIADLEETLSAELQRVGADAPIAVLPEGPMTIPYVEA